MYKRSIFVISVGVLLLALLFMGCSSGASPVLPDPGISPQKTSAGQANRVLWGYFNVSINPQTMAAEIVPLRGAEFTANVTQFMQPPISPTPMVSLTIDPSSDFATGYVVVDVTLQHPFPGMNFYNGFDVRGILFSDGSVSGIHDSTVLRAGPDDTRLQNADGYTRFWNWPEFTSYESIFGATHGKLAPPNQPTATVNAYKYFADDLGLEDAVAALDPDSRGFFTSASSNSRRYEIQFKMEDDSIVFDFNYAIDASWNQPDPAFSPDYPVEAFALSANCQEAFNVDVTDAGSTAWYVNGTENGGEFVLDIEIFDWQGGANDDVPSEIAGLYLEGDVLGGAADVLSGATILPGSTVNSSIYEVTIGSLTLTNSGDFELFGTVESADPNTYKPQINGGSTFAYPASPLAAFFTCAVTVLDQSPEPIPTVTGIDPDSGIPDCTPEHVTVTGTNFIDGATFRLEKDGETDIIADDVVFIDDTTLEGDLDLLGAAFGLWDVVVEKPGGITGTLVDGFTVLDVIFVDGDNIGDMLEDGSEEHPFDVIQEGLDAAYASNDEPVIVDQCANNYDPFSLHDNSHVIGCNWNDGVGWPTVEQTDSYTYGNGVNNAAIEGLFFDITMPSGGSGLYFTGGDGLTITRCKFSGVITGVLAGSWYTLSMDLVNNVEISYCEFTEIFNRSPQTGSNRYLRATFFTRINGLHIHHCEFHNIGFDQWDSGTNGRTETMAVYCNNLYTGSNYNINLHNLLIYDFFDKTNALAPGSDNWNCISAFRVYTPKGDYFDLCNITVDNLRHADPPSTTTVISGRANAAYITSVSATTRTWKNNIASNIIPTDDEPMEHGVSAYYGWWGDMPFDPPPSPQPMDYSCCYNLGKPLPNGANPYGWASGFVNQVSAGAGCYLNSQNIDPQYDMTPGANFYHPTNTLISEGADDGGEMGAFGGPDGDWIPPSQL